MAVRCGNRKVHGEHPEYHESAAEVRRCFTTPGGLASLGEAEQDEQNALAELAAERRAERYWEDRGYDDARAQEQYEAAHGVVQPEQARLEWEHAQQSPVEPEQPAQIFDGIYTLEKPDGSHRTFRLRTQPEDAKFAPGQQIIAYLSGSDNESDYTGFGFVVNGRAVKVWNRFKENFDLALDAENLLRNPEAALKAVHCYRCHRVLTVPASLYAGLGPECAKKAGI